MKVFLDKDSETNYIEIILTEKDVERLRDYQGVDLNVEIFNKRCNIFIRR